MADVALWRLPSGAGTGIERVPLGPAPASLDELSLTLPQGAYTTFRTFGRTAVLRLDEHLGRLEESARLSGAEVYLDWLKVRTSLQQAIAAFDAPEVRVRLTLDLTHQPGTVYLGLEPLRPPVPEHYQSGVRAVTLQFQRQNPKAKATSFLSAAREVRQGLPPGISEGIMVSPEGRLLEGLSSNFYAVRAGELWTAEEAVLPGITRALVLEEAADEGLMIHLEGLPASQLGTIDEAFITSSGRGVLPVVEVDGQPIGTGAPGPITRRLLDRYNQRIARQVEPII